MDERQMYADSVQNDGTLFLSQTAKDGHVYLEIRNVTAGVAWMCLSKGDAIAVMEFLSRVTM